jgi:hypothetical protein
MWRAPSPPATHDAPSARGVGPSSEPTPDPTPDACTGVVGEGDRLLPLLTPSQAAELLAVRESWLRRRATARTVPCTFLGKQPASRRRERALPRRRRRVAWDAALDALVASGLDLAPELTALRERGRHIADELIEKGS